ncbi:MAG: metal transporter substrate-binding protein [Rhodospirillales bacterium]|nr:metal transporter substrate-binding protein [Rhodospirillales bacterium]
MRRLLLLLATILLGAGAAQAQPQTKILIGYTAVAEYASAMIAKEEGFFAKRGLDVELVAVQLNSTIPAALVSNSLQMGIPTPSILLQANDGGLDLVIIGNVSVSDPSADSNAVLVRPGSGLKTPQDLIGKKVAVPGLNALIHVLFREWLTVKGVDYKQVIFVEGAMPQLGEMLKAGSVDAVVLVDPFYHRVLAAGMGEVLSRYNADLPAGIATSFYATTREWANAHSEAVKGLQAAMREANQFHKDNPEAWRPIVGKYIKLPPEVLATLRPPNLDFEITPQQIDQWADIMTRQGMLTHKPDAAAIIIR